jgi:hypothetical protein
VIHAEKIYENIPHSYNIPSTIEVKRGNAFKGGRYVPPQTSRTPSIATSAISKKCTKYPDPAITPCPPCWKRKRQALSHDWLISALKEWNQ